MDESAFYREIIRRILDDRLSKDSLNREKIRLCSDMGLKRIPTDIEILLHASPEDIPLLKVLQTKPTRSLSGVAVVAVMTKPRECPHGKCVMCPGGVGSDFGTVPQSYTGKEPATRRAIRNRYDAYLQVFNRLEQYIVTGHVPDKVELIVMGGTFPAAPVSYQERFITDCFSALNDFSERFFKRGELDFLGFRRFFELPGDITDEKRNSRIRRKALDLKRYGVRSLEDEQARNERSKIRCVGLTIETRPDYAKIKQADKMLRLGCTRVELGVQTVYDDVLEGIKRGHSVQDSIDATRILKDLGFKINYHMMPGLPGVSRKKDMESLKKIFSDRSFRPDMLKLYPCMVLKGTKLYKRWKRGAYSPITTKSAASLIADFKEVVPDYVRIMRVQRDIPTFMTEAGVDRTNLRQYIASLMERRGTGCRCIRCREAGRNDCSGKEYQIKRMEYVASMGKEFFISAEADDCLLGFIRMRFPSQSLRKEIAEDCALIRELHVFGESASLGKSGKIQHRGIGKALLETAENIAKREKRGKIVIISGVGVRQYYRKLGYRKQGPYMVKRL
jgi:elongator complex protein 3